MPRKKAVVVETPENEMALSTAENGESGDTLINTDAGVAEETEAVNAVHQAEATDQGTPDEAIVIKKRPRRIGATRTSRNTKERKPTGQSFYDVDYNEYDKDLSPDQLKEWTAIYASYRSRTPLTGTVIGVDTHRLAMTDPVTKHLEHKQILCLVVMEYRVKVIIPQTEIWYDPGTELPDYVIKRMVGAKIDYVITNVDRPEECAIASRRMALGHARNHFFSDRRDRSQDRFKHAMSLL